MDEYTEYAHWKTGPDRRELHARGLDDLVEPVNVLVDVRGELSVGGGFVELVAVLDPDGFDLDPVGRRDRLVEPHQNARSELLEASYATGSVVPKWLPLTVFADDPFESSTTSRTTITPSTAAAASQLRRFLPPRSWKS